MKWLPVDYILTHFLPGDEWSWAEEFVNLAELEGQKLIDFCQLIAVEGINEPIILGHDSRVWDGHHRIFAALTLGILALEYKYPEED